MTKKGEEEVLVYFTDSILDRVNPEQVKLSALSRHTRYRAVVTVEGKVYQMSQGSENVEGIQEMYHAHIPSHRTAKLFVEPCRPLNRQHRFY